MPGVGSSSEPMRLHVSGSGNVGSSTLDNVLGSIAGAPMGAVHGLGNLASDIQHSASGFFPGLALLGESTWNQFKASNGSAGQRFSAHAWESHHPNAPTLGRIVQSTLKDYSHTYGPALSGDPGLTLQRIYQHPLGPVLDVLTVASLGAGALGKAGRLSAGLHYSGFGAKIAGLEKVAVPEGMTPKEFLAVQRAATKSARVGGEPGITIANDVSHVYLPKPRILSTAAAKATGLSPKVALDQGKAITLPTSINPLQRLRMAAVDKLSQAYPEAWVTGANRRVARGLDKSIRNRELRLSGQHGMQGALAANRAARKLSPTAHASFMDLQAQGVGAGERIGQLKQGVRSLNLGGEVDRVKAARQSLAKLSSQASKSKWAPAYTARVAGERAAQTRGEIQQLHAEIKDHGKQLVKLNETPAAKTFNRTYSKRKSAGPLNVVPENAMVKTAVKGGNVLSHEQEIQRVRDLIAKKQLHVRSKQLQYSALRKVNRSGNVSKHLAELDQRLKAHAMQGELKPQMQARIALHETPISSREQFVVNRLLKSMRPVTEGQTANLNKARQLAPGPGGYKPLESAQAKVTAQRLVGRSEANLNHDVMNVPHTTDRGARSYRLTASMKPGKNIPKPDALRYRSGFSYRYAMNAIKPRGILDAYQQSARFLSSRMRWQKMLDNMIPVGTLDEVPKNFVEVSPARLREWAHNVHVLARDEFPAAFGESPQLQEAVDQLASQIDRRFNGAERVVVPKSIDRVLTKELDSAETAMKKFEAMRGFDKGTLFWRTLTLHGRAIPWTVNNIIGQMFLLGATQGVMRSVRSGMELAMSPEARAAVKENSGAITMGGPAHVLTQENVSIANSFGHKLTQLAAQGIKKPTEFIGRWSQAIGDDPWRRMAFYSEIRDPVRVLMKEKGLGFGDAAKELLAQPGVMDRVEEKVLGDLIDFADLTPSERATVRRLSPFYSWIKGVTKRTSRLAVENPGKTNLGVHIGQAGYNENVKRLGGPVPDYIAGSIPLPPGVSDFLGVGKGKDRKGVLVTQGANPFMTPADIVGTLGYLTGATKGGTYGGENPLSQINPLVSSPIAALTGVKPFTGQSLSGSFPERIGSVAAESTPITKSLMDLYNKSRDKKFNSAALYKATPQSFLYQNLLGLPVRDLNVKQALKYGNGPRNAMVVPLPKQQGYHNSTFAVAPNGDLLAIQDVGKPKHG